MNKTITGKKNGEGNGDLFKQNSLRVLAVIIILSVTVAFVWYMELDSKSVKINQHLGSMGDIGSFGEDSGYSPETKNMLRLVITRDDCKSGDLILVNRDCPWEDTPENLVSVLKNANGTYNVSDYNVKLNSRVCEALNSWLGEFYRNYGETDLLVASGYRSVDAQQSIYEDDADKNGEDVTERWIAFPGTSEHHTGLAVDMSIYNTEDKTSAEFDGSGVYENLLKTCKDYGFILRYPEDKTEITGIDYEPWHFRYVGKGHSQYITENDLCLEEYIELLKEYSWDAPLCFEYESTEYRVFWVSSASLPENVYIPEGYQYNISSDNSSGVIVTCFKGI